MFYLALLYKISVVFRLNSIKVNFLKLGLKLKIESKHFHEQKLQFSPRFTISIVPTESPSN